MDGHPGADGAGPAAVHLTLRGASDEALGALRQSLAACLAADVTQVRVHAEGQDVELPVLLALRAAADVLAARGGQLLLLGAGEQVRRRVAVHGLEPLLEAPGDPYPDAAPDPSQASSRDARRT